METCDFKEVNFNNSTISRSIFKDNNLSAFEAVDSLFEDCKFEACFLPEIFSAIAGNNLDIVDPVLVSDNERVIRRFLSDDGSDLSSEIQQMKLLDDN